MVLLGSVAKCDISTSRPLDKDTEQIYGWDEIKKEKKKKKKKAAAVITFSADLFCTYYIALYLFNLLLVGPKKKTDRVEKWPLEFAEFKERF